jgi:DNA-binding CsgD family transcriptional regulator
LDGHFCSIFIVKLITLRNAAGVGLQQRNGTADLDQYELLASLTAKQREVLDLLLQHKTSKEIARILQISPHTVDQRIQFAKDKLGAQSRSEVAMLYRRLIAICEQSTYEDSGIAVPAGAPHEVLARQVASPGTEQGTRTQSTPPADAELDYAVVQELFDGRYGTLARLGAIVAIAVLLVIIVVGGVAILSQLSALLRG